MELWNEIESKIQELDASVKNLRKAGTDYANAEREYKIALKKEVLRLRDSGMAVTLIPLVVYGNEEIASLRANRDIKEAVYDANKEAINTTKIVIKVLQEQWKQEYGNTKFMEG